jgi:diguanylate cyclase (GGDEF)-like protein
MGKLPEEISKILLILDSLDESPAEQIFFDHLRHVLKEQSEQGCNKEELFSEITRRLLKTLMPIIGVSDEVGVKRLAVLNALLEPPCSLVDLKSVASGILILQELSQVGVKPESLVGKPTLSNKPNLDVTSTEENKELEQQLNSNYRENLSDGDQEVQKIQLYLAKKIASLSGSSQSFGELLENVVGTLKNSTSAETVDQARCSLIEQAGILSESHQQLQKQLERTQEYLKFLEDNGQQLNKELKRVRLLSLTDELTGLPNRRAFLRRLEDEVGRVRRYNVPLSLAMLDLDYFKLINDKYGHGAGDAALKAFSSKVLSTFRHLDLVARYGGEEFIVLMPNTDRDGAARALEKIQRKCKEELFLRNGEKAHLPTFSAGIAVYKPGETATNFIERADRALYSAKELGRNRYEFDDDQSGNGENWTDVTGL